MYDKNDKSGRAYAQNARAAAEAAKAAEAAEIRAWAQSSIGLKKSDAAFGPETFSSVAEEAARRCSKSSEINKSSQIRMFYDELEGWYAKVAAADDPAKKFSDVLPYVRMMRAKLAYAKGRKLIDAEFFNIMSVCIEKVVDVESLMHCKLFFEAFLGFRKALEK